MKLRHLCVCSSLFVVSFVLCAAASAQTTPGLTGSGTATFASSTQYAGVTLTGLDFGAGIEIPGDTSATGNFHTTLQGAGRSIEVDCRVSAGSIAANDSTTLAGTCSVNLGDGSAPSSGVALSVVAVPDGSGRGTLTIKLGSTTLAAASIQDGILTIRR